MSNPSRRSTDDSSIKETLQSIIVAFILAFVFRAFVVEAFVIPTGSMAPTLLGQHIQFVCPQCGYRFTSGPRDNYYNNKTNQYVPRPIQGRQVLHNVRTGQNFPRPPLQALCPMCGYPVTIDRTSVNAGDRILVLKYVYAFSEPRRWDVVVFRNPEQPRINYIKRLIGLPDEWLRIIRGNIYTSKDQGRTWHIQRKPLKVQRAVWQPLYHSDYVPLDEGDSPKRQAIWTNPWQPAGTADWKTEHRGNTFIFSPAAGKGTSGKVGTLGGTLNFDFANHPFDAMDYYAYNELPLSNVPEPPTTTLVEDLRVGVTVLPEQTGGSVELNIGGELFNYQGVIKPDGSVQLRMRSPIPPAWTKGERKWVTVARASGPPLSVDHPHRVELWCVDQSVQLWLDGAVVARYDIPVLDKPDAKSPFVLSVQTLLSHNGVKRPPRVSIEVADAPMHLSDLDLDRDLYYTNMRQSTALATYNNVAKLADNEFFCLGDNSPQSKDGRLWTTVNPWVEYHTRHGHKHLAPDGRKLPGVGTGIVPRQLMIGRAFFVYWPAPDRLSINSWMRVPNFGDMRFIH